MVFVDIKNDVAFRKIFGDHQKTEVLISFLNAVLETKGDRIITQVTILNPFQLAVYGSGKTTIIDVKARDQAGREYIVEMQVAEATDLARRYHWSKDELNAYDYAEMRAQDERGKMELALARVEKEGMEKGIKEGIEKKAEEVAIKLLKKGMELDFIVETTNLPLARVEELAKNNSLN